MAMFQTKVMLRGAALAIAKSAVKTSTAMAATAIAFGVGLTPAARADSPIQIEPRLSQSVVRSGKTSRIYLRVGIKVARLQRRTDRAPLNLALVIDRSGSMQGARIDNARKAAMMAVDRLSSSDIVSVVSYDDRIGIEVPATKAAHAYRIKHRIRSLTARGSTAIHAGLMAGMGEIRKFKSRDYINRVILLSDGLANVGPRTPQHFANLGREFAAEGITVSTIGLGLGYNEDLMTRLAINADGSHVFVQEPADLARFLAREIDDVQSIFAQDVDITIEFHGGVRPIRSLGRTASLEATRLTWKLGQLIGGAEQVLLAEIEAPAEFDPGTRQIAKVSLAYRKADGGARESHLETVALKATDDDAEIKTSFSAEVMRDATVLDIRRRKDAAIKLRDAGKLEEARKAFEQNAQQISQQASKYGFKVDGILRQEQVSNEAAASPAAASSAGWNKQRKIMRGQDANNFGASKRY